MPTSSFAANQSHFEAFLKSVPLGVAIFDREHRFLQINEMIADMNGIPLAEHLGQRLQDLLPVNARTVSPILDSVFASGKPTATHEIAGETPREPGVQRYWLTGYFPVGRAGGEVEAVGVWCTEISDWRQAEEALKRREEQLRLALASAGTGLWALTIATGAVSWSAETYALHGMVPGQFGGTAEAFFEIVHPADRAGLRAKLESAIEGRFDFESEFRIVLPDGRVRWVANRGRAVYGPDGNPVEVLGTITDIDQRKSAESDLRESEERFRSTFDNAAVGIAHVAPDGSWLAVNDRLCEIIGYSRSELLAGNFQQITHPEDLAKDTALAADVVAGRRERYAMEKRYLRKDGSEVWVNLTASARRNPDGSLRHFISVVEHIEKRKRSEQALQAALQASQTGTFRWDFTRDSLTWDDALDRLFGLTPGESVRHLQAFLARVHPDDRPGVIERCERCRAVGADFEMEFRVVWPDGSERWLYDRGRTFRDAAGNPSYMTGACVDITDRRKVEQALQEADRQKDEFLAMLAHELRNPLAPLRSGLEILRRSDSPEAQGRARDIMTRQLGHMVRLVDDLLDVSRIRRGKFELRREEVAVRAALEHALESVRPSIDQRRQYLAVRLCPDALTVQGDLTRLAQIAGNLLSNASKYTPEGGRIEVELDREGGEAVLRVKDNGIGIAPDMMGKVFDLFVQIDRSLDRSQGGLGIGLALVRKLVEMHGGTVHGESAGPDAGSTFTVRLPLLEAVPPPSDVQASTESRAPSRRVLVVDDNVDGAQNMAEMLRLLGHDARYATSGPQALEALEGFLPEVVLLDIGMPGMSGYEVARRMRSHAATSSAMLVALTGWGTEEDRRKCYEAGFDVHLTKPVDVAAVEMVLLGARNGRPAAHA